jgi:hypothetical protein
VPEAFELGDEPSGLGFVVASAVPVGSEVVVGLVAFEHPRTPAHVVGGAVGPARLDNDRIQLG